MDKNNVAEILIDIGLLLELKGENPFKTRAYGNAARAVENLAEPLEKVVAENRLGEVKGIGEGIGKKIKELVETGSLKYYNELRASIPSGLAEMLEIPGLGPRKIKALHDKLGIVDVEQLQAACKAGKVAELAGFGQKTAANICEGIERRRLYSGKMLLSAALNDFVSSASTCAWSMPRTAFVNIMFPESMTDGAIVALNGIMSSVLSAFATADVMTAPFLTSILSFAITTFPFWIWTSIPACFSSVTVWPGWRLVSPDAIGMSSGEIWFGFAASFIEFALKSL